MGSRQDYLISAGNEILDKSWFLHDLGFHESKLAHANIASIYGCANAWTPNHAERDSARFQEEAMATAAPTFWTLSGLSPMQLRRRQHDTVCAAENISFHTQSIPCSRSSSRAHTSHTSKDSSASLLAYAVQPECAADVGWRIGSFTVSIDSKGRHDEPLNSNGIGTQADGHEI
ncbi:hypothetical protein Tdes44962_MAKER08005 [Teratosphaeria destructans]|uniref:Uncharacterized protein n=1 Tax=Teratosphaeria destructans TaxID=418781 RepID=A0A9W7W516_9PEZI|nr:hypothetical protein Tdes44962_MAKER08005 [Teratosphaeria destructans]